LTNTALDLLGVYSTGTACLRTKTFASHFRSFRSFEISLLSRAYVSVYWLSTASLNMYLSCIFRYRSRSNIVVAFLWFYALYFVTLYW